MIITGGPAAGLQRGGDTGHQRTHASQGAWGSVSSPACFQAFPPWDEKPPELKSLETHQGSSDLLRRVWDALQPGGRHDQRWCARTHTHSLTLTHTHSHMHTHSCAHTFTHTHTLNPGGPPQAGPGCWWSHALGRSGLGAEDLGSSRRTPSGSEGCCVRTFGATDPEGPDAEELVLAGGAGPGQP